MFLSIRELMHAKVRYILIGLIIILIATLIFVISGLAEGLSANNASAIQNMDADYLIVEKNVESNLTKSAIPSVSLDKISETDGIEAVSPLKVQMMNAVVGDTNKSIDVALFMTNAKGILIPDIIEGKAMKGPNEVIADDTLKEDGVKIGDTLSGNNGETVFKIVGFAHSERYSHTSVVYVNEKAELFTSAESIAMQANKGETVNAFAIQADKAKIDNIKKDLGSSFDIVTTKEALKGIPSFSQEQASLNMMIVFLLVIAAFVLAVFFYVMTLQKRGQFGVLKALGTKTSYLIRSLLGQVVIITVVCIAIAVGVTYGVNAILPAGMPFLLNADKMIQSAAIILVLSILGAFVSFIQVIKIDPIEAIEGADK